MEDETTVPMTPTDVITTPTTAADTIIPSTVIPKVNTGPPPKTPVTTTEIANPIEMAQSEQEAASPTVYTSSTLPQQSATYGPDNLSDI